MSTALCSSAEQMVLFDAGVDLVRLRRAREVFMGAGKAPNTEAAYRSAFKLFARWCVDAGRSSLPATPETLSLYAASLLEQRYRLGTIRVKMSGVADRHVAAGFASPFDDSVRLMLSNAARLLHERPRFKAAITPEQVRRVVSIVGERPKDVRDRCLFVCGFALGWRRSELRSLDFADVAFGSKGVTFHLGASKADQKGKGRVVSVPFGVLPATCPVRNLQFWLDVRGRWRGPLFCPVRHSHVERSRLGDRAICSVVQMLLDRIGEDSSSFGAHSLRAGMATAAAEAGASDIAIMQRGGWRSLETVLRYIRPTLGFRADPLAGVL